MKSRLKLVAMEKGATYNYDAPVRPLG